MGMQFKKWLLEVGGQGGPGGGLTPPLQNPLVYQGSLTDYYDDSHKDPANPNGKLPPVKKTKKNLNKTLELKNGKY
jgi:hypothetical protein